MESELKRVKEQLAEQKTEADGDKQELRDKIMELMGTNEAARNQLQ